MGNRCVNKMSVHLTLERINAIIFSIKLKLNKIKLVQQFFFLCVVLWMVIFIYIICIGTFRILPIIDETSFGLCMYTKKMTIFTFTFSLLLNENRYTYNWIINNFYINIFIRFSRYNFSVQFLVYAVVMVIVQLLLLFMWMRPFDWPIVECNQFFFSIYTVFGHQFYDKRWGQLVFVPKCHTCK